MSSVDPKILSKIKKCLALSSSSNPNEAAVALKQAHALMEKYGISTEQIQMADIGEAAVRSKTMARDKPAHWEMRLAAVVGLAFGCEILVERNVTSSDALKKHLNNGAYVYVGLKHQAEVASYTAAVLIRRCKAARQKWISDNLSDLNVKGVKGVKAKITRMGDMFAQGWVESIRRLVNEFANPPEVSSAIRGYIEAKNVRGPAPARGAPSGDIGRAEKAAILMGADAAAGESLHRPMESAGAQLSLGHG